MKQIERVMQSVRRNTQNKPYLWIEMKCDLCHHILILFSFYLFVVQCPLPYTRQVKLKFVVHILLCTKHFAPILLFYKIPLRVFYCALNNLHVFYFLKNTVARTLLSEN